jgi:glycosyltransferase involved in cell wall biosynthesis
VIVGVDARAATEVPAGRGRVVRELLRAWAARDDDARFRLYCREPWKELGDRFEWVTVPARDPLWHVRTAIRANRECDVFLSTNSYLTAWFTRIPCAVIVYDLVPFVDGAHAQARAARIERATIRPTLRRAASLLCISEATRADLVARFPATVPRACVVPLAADADFFAAQPDPATNERHGLDRPYVLAVGTLEPRKNLERLVAAWEGLADTHTLALVGPRGWDDETIVAAARRAGDVRLLGHVSDADLAALYAGADCFAYPSLYEGFGLPVLEAMAAGAPVLTSNVSSLPEVAGDAALLVDPRDSDAIRAGLARLLGDGALRAGLRARGRARAAQYSWDRTAAEMLRALEAISR